MFFSIFQVDTKRNFTFQELSHQISLKGFTCCLQQRPVSIPPPSLMSPSSSWWWDSRGSSASCDAAGWCICHRDGVEWLHQPISSSGSLMLLNLSTSSLGAATTMSRSSAWLHFMQLLSLLSSSSRARRWQSLQPEAWTDVWFCGSLVCVTASLPVAAEDIILCQVGTTAELLPRDWWAPTQPFFCDCTLPARPSSVNCCACCCRELGLKMGSSKVLKGN